MPEELNGFASLTVAEAANRLGITTEGVRARIKRGVYETQKGNDGRRRVLVPRSALPQTDTQQPQPDHTDDGLHDALEGELDRLASELERTRTDLETWRIKAEEARLDAVRADAEHKAAERIITDLREQRDRLAAELARLRQPWWRWFIGAP